jgi:hypothetical protein
MTFLSPTSRENGSCVSTDKILTAKPCVKYKDILLSKKSAAAMNGLATAHNNDTHTHYMTAIADHLIEK